MLSAWSIRRKRLPVRIPSQRQARGIQAAGRAIQFWNDPATVSLIGRLAAIEHNSSRQYGVLLRPRAPARTNPPSPRLEPASSAPCQSSTITGDFRSLCDVGCGHGTRSERATRQAAKSNYRRPCQERRPEGPHTVPPFRFRVAQRGIDRKSKIATPRLRW